METKRLHTIRATKNSGGYSFVGMANVANFVDSQDDDTQPGAWSKDIAINGNKRPLCWNHDGNEPIGFVLVADTPQGLKVTEGHLSKGVRRADDLAVLLSDGVVNFMSVGYNTIKSRRGKNATRLLDECELMEVSLVLWPANVRSRITELRNNPRVSSAKLDDVLARIRRITALVAKSQQGQTDAADLDALLTSLRGFTK